MYREELLIIDDDPVQIRALCEILGDEYNTRFATNGHDGKSLAMATDKPDLILLDINMPDINGFQLCKELKSSEETKSIPVLFVTGRIDDEDQVHAFNIGAADFISKPISPSVLKARVRTQLELSRKSRALEELAMTDGLTHIANRLGFDLHLDSEWHRLQRVQKPIALLILDVDNFKAFNDNYGHSVGDTCLKKLANVMQKSLSRSTDFAARVGGEEFAIILPETDVDGAKTVANNLITALNDANIRHEYSTVSDRVTVSIGIALLTPRDDCSTADLYNQADEALYYVKRRTKNTFMVFSEIASM